MNDLKQQLAEALAQCQRLRAENARFIALLNQYGIDHQSPSEIINHAVELPPEEPALPPRVSKNLSSDGKIALFRRL